VPQTSAAITNPEAFLEGNFPLPLDVEDSVQPAGISSQHPDVAAEQCQIAAEFVAGTDGSSVRVSGIK
jgi:hypothetical protein